MVCAFRSRNKTLNTLLHPPPTGNAKPNASGPNRDLVINTPVSRVATPSGGQEIALFPEERAKVKESTIPIEESSLGSELGDAFPLGRLTSNLKPMGPAASAGRMAIRNPETASAAVDARAETPDDLQQANTTTMEEPLRLWLNPGDRWMSDDPQCYPMPPGPTDDQSGYGACGSVVFATPYPSPVRNPAID